MAQARLKFFDLGGKSVALTGGYGHLGRAIALGLHEAGATVFVLGRSEERFARAFEGADERLRFVPCDVASSEQVDSAVERVRAEHGSLDVLINNAFYLSGGDPENTSDEDWAHSLDGVLGSAYRCIRAAIPAMKAQGSGKIINVCSMYGAVAPDMAAYADHPQFRNPPHYGAGKAALAQLTRYYAEHLGPHGIQVNAVSPGPFPSPAVQESRGFIDALEERTMLGRIGRPEDLQGVFVLLSSAASDYITGETIAVDGGWTAR